MYYNSNRNSNEYYSSYRKELSAIEADDNNNKNSLSLAIKRVGIAVLFLALIFGSFYLIKHFLVDKKEISTLNRIDNENQISSSQTNNEFEEDTTISKMNNKNSIRSSQLTNQHIEDNEKITRRAKTKPHSSRNSNNLAKNNSETEKIPRIIRVEKNLPKSIQLQKSESKIISNLKHNATDSLAQNSPLKSKEYNAIQKEVVALKETSNMEADDIEHIVNLILSKIKKKNKSSLEEELLNAESKNSKTKTLKESNHYNKVLLSSKNRDSNSKLQNINNKFEKSHNKRKLSKYEKSLQPEIDTRSNEMRIIIVRKGDTLSKIALRAYGKRDAYTKIFKANPEIIKNPNNIYVGQKIRIPK